MSIARPGHHSSRRKPCLKRRNGATVTAHNHTIISIADDIRSKNIKYFIQLSNGKYEEVFTYSRWHINQLHQLKYADGSLVPTQNTVITACDGAQNRYFEIQLNGTVIEIYATLNAKIVSPVSPKTIDYQLQHKSCVDLSLCYMLLRCIQENCSMLTFPITHAIPSDQLSPLMKIALNLDIAGCETQQTIAASAIEHHAIVPVKTNLQPPDTETLDIDLQELERLLQRGDQLPTLEEIESFKKFFETQTPSSSPFITQNFFNTTDKTTIETNDICPLPKMSRFA